MARVVEWLVYQAANVHTPDATRVAATDLGVYLGVLLAAVANEYELPAGELGQNALYPLDLVLRRVAQNVQHRSIHAPRLEGLQSERLEVHGSVGERPACIGGIRQPAVEQVCHGPRAGAGGDGAVLERCWMEVRKALERCLRDMDDGRWTTDDELPDIVECDIEALFLVPAAVDCRHGGHGPEETQQAGDAGREGGWRVGCEHSYSLSIYTYIYIRESDGQSTHDTLYRLGLGLT